MLRKQYQISILVIIFSIYSINCIESIEFNEKVIRYLKKYGYLSNEKPIENISGEELSEGLNKLQEFISFDRTSDLSIEEVMNISRCGQPDIQFTNQNENIRDKRFVLSNKKWFYTFFKPLLLVYFIDPQLQQRGFDQNIETAIAIWSNISNINFTKGTDQRKPHQLYFKPKIGSGGLGSDKRYDISQYKYDKRDDRLVICIMTVDLDQYSDNNSLNNAFIHMLGHCLGLSHTSDPTSVMYPFFVKPTTVQPSIDDITAIQTLYGINPNKSEIDFIHMNPNRADWTSKPPNLCSNPKIDSALELPSGKWIFFKGQHYYEIGPFGQTVNTPRRISWDFESVETPIDASLDWSEDIIFLFKGEIYWKYKDKTLISSRKVSEGFNGIPSGPFDDVFRWNVNQKTYFFKGNQYWKYDSRTKSVPNGYPKQVTDVWKGIPVSFDAALSSRKRNQTYFFKDNLFYRFDDLNKKVVDDQTPPYPRMAEIYFYKCRNMKQIPKWAQPPIAPTYAPEIPTLSTTESLPFNFVTPEDGVDFLVIILSIITLLMCILIGFTLFPNGIDWIINTIGLSTNNQNSNFQKGSTRAVGSSTTPSTQPALQIQTIQSPTVSNIEEPENSTKPKNSPTNDPDKSDKVNRDTSN